MPFTSTDFHDLLDPDLWVIEQMLTLPSDPEPTVTHKDGALHVEIDDTVAMSQMQAAVTKYRRCILPVIFIVSQKVYAELFRLVLCQCGGSAGDKQFNVERAIGALVSAGRIETFRPFPNAASFHSWWSGKYCFTTLRLARNQVVHSSYVFTGGRLSVSDDTGGCLLDWTEAEILSFAREVLRLSKKV
jgi:hypothetical protein